MMPDMESLASFSVISLAAFFAESPVHIATIQGRAGQSGLTWSGITIGKSHHHHHHQMSLYNIELSNTYCHNPGQSKV